MPCGSKPVNAGQRHSPTPKNSQQEHQQELRCEITRLANKVAIVTGAGTRSQNVSGVGVATAKAFADQGAKILIVDMDETAAQITERAITEAGGEASIYVADVAHESGCRELVEAAVESYGKLDILMNSVGILGRGSVMEIEEDSWQRVLDVNLKSMAFISKFAVTAMIDSGGGSIINISSVDGIRAGMSHLDALSFAALDADDMLVATIQCFPVALIDREGRPVPLVMVAGQVVVRDGVPTSLVGTHRTGSFLRAGQRSSIPVRAEASESSTASDQASLTATQVSA